MSPLQIDMLLHIHCRASPIPNIESPHGAQRTEVEWFIEQELIAPSDQTGSGYRLLPRGQAYVRFLQAMPLPMANWVIPGPWNPSSPTLTSGD